MRIRFTTAFAAVALLIACQTPSTDAMQTSARGRFVDDISRDLVEFHGMKHPECRNAHVVSSRVVSREKDGFIKEIWTMEGCGHAFSYWVTIMPPSGGGNMDMVGPEIVN